MATKQDLFISHATADQERYVRPLTDALTSRGISFWSSSNESQWGDNFVAKINDGLRKSRFALLCLSSNFLGRQWAQTEMDAALAIQNSNGVKKVLPLICNSKAKILRTYPIVAHLAYREFKSGVESLVEEISDLTRQKSNRATGLVWITIESVHTDKLSNLHVSPRTSLKWLAEKARVSAGLKDSADIGAMDKLPVRWVLVDMKAQQEWEAMSASDMIKTKALVKLKSGLKASYRYEDRLEDFGVYDGIVFHLYAVPYTNEPESRGGGGGGYGKLILPKVVHYHE